MRERQETIIACIPASFEKFNDEQKLLMHMRGVVEGRPMYKESTVIQCDSCGCDVWLGPRQKEVRDRDKCKAWCWMCCAGHMDEDTEATLVDLGNTDQLDAEDN